MLCWVLLLVASYAMLLVCSQRKDCEVKVKLKAGHLFPAPLVRVRMNEGIIP